MKPFFFTGLFICLCAALSPLVWSDSVRGEKPIQVLTSIRPLALIAEDLLAETGSVEVLVAGAASPHDYALKVSDMKRLQDADLVVWMGPQLERFLVKPLRGLDEARVLALGEGGQDSHDEHEHADDLHQWLDPRIAQDMARQIADRLVKLMPERREQILQRLESTLDSYEKLHVGIQQTLSPVRDVGFVVQHRGYDFLVDAYGLNQLGWLTANPEQPAGARHLFELERKLRGAENGAACLFVERSHQSATSLTMAEQLNLRVQPLDILGGRADSYVGLMRNLTTDLHGCLSGG